MTNEVVKPELPLCFKGDGDFFETVYCKESNTVFIKPTKSFEDKFKDICDLAYNSLQHEEY